MGTSETYVNLYQNKRHYIPKMSFIVTECGLRTSRYYRLPLLKLFDQIKCRSLLYSYVIFYPEVWIPAHPSPTLPHPSQPSPPLPPSPTPSPLNLENRTEYIRKRLKIAFYLQWSANGGWVEYKFLCSTRKKDTD